MKYSIITILGFIIFTPCFAQVSNDSSYIDGDYIIEVDRFDFVDFVPFEDKLTIEGMLELDKLGGYLTKNEEMFDSLRIIFSPWNSEQEYQKNPYLGFYRYRVVKKYLLDKFCLDNSYFIFRDSYYIYHGEYKKVCHIGTCSGVSYSATRCRN